MYMHRHGQNVSNTDVSIVHGYVDVVKATANEKAGIAFFRSREGKNNFFCVFFYPCISRSKWVFARILVSPTGLFPVVTKQTNKASHYRSLICLFSIPKLILLLTSGIVLGIMRYLENVCCETKSFQQNSISRLFF